MAVIYLKHPIHGAKVAISDMEASNDMQLGWEPFDPTQPEPEPAPTAPVAVKPEPVNLLAQPPRRGRPRKE
jgi:hypothetical protein